MTCGAGVCDGYKDRMNIAGSPKPVTAGTGPDTVLREMDLEPSLPKAFPEVKN